MNRSIEQTIAEAADHGKVRVHSVMRWIVLCMPDSVFATDMRFCLWLHLDYCGELHRVERYLYPF